MNLIDESYSRATDEKEKEVDEEIDMMMEVNAMAMGR